MQPAANAAARASIPGGASSSSVLRPESTIAKVTPASEVLRAALAYAAQGYHVLPVRPGGKVPLTEHGCHDATSDEDTIRGWWTTWPMANVGIATQGLLVVDIDPDGLPWGTKHDAALSEAGGRWTATPRGHHAWFRAPEGVDIRCSAGRIAAGVDVRAAGGYVVVPPSRTEHGEYVGVLPRPAELAEVPAWLLALLAPPRTAPRNGAARSLPAGGPIPEGERHSTLLSIGGRARALGADVHAAIAEAAGRCDPPMPRREVEALADDIERRYSAGSAPSDGRRPTASAARPTLPDYPLHVLPTWLRAVVEAHAAATDAAPELAAAPALAALGWALGPGWRVRARSYVAASRVWLAVVASSGQGKTPTAMPILTPLQDEEEQLRTAHKLAMARWAADERERRKNKSAEINPSPLRERVIVTDVTIEGLGLALEGSPRGLLLDADEIAMLICSCDAYHGGRPGRDRAAWLSLWSGKAVRVARKSARDIDAPDPFVCVVGGTQPARLASLGLSDGDGLAARWLWSWPAPREAGLGHEVSERAATMWRSALHAARCAKGAEMVFAPDAIDDIDAALRRWRRRAAELEDAGQGLAAAATAKTAEQAMRLAAMLHGADRLDPDAETLTPTVVPRSTWARAAELAEYHLAHGLAVVERTLAREAEAPTADDALGARLAELVAAAPGGEIRDTPSGFAGRLGLPSPDTAGRALRRLAADPPPGLELVREARTDRRIWRAHTRESGESGESVGGGDA